MFKDSFHSMESGFCTRLATPTTVASLDPRSSRFNVMLGRHLNSRPSLLRSAGEAGIANHEASALAYTGHLDR
jgi:hypothetical protein